MIYHFVCMTFYETASYKCKQVQKFHLGTGMITRHSVNCSWTNLNLKMEIQNMCLTFSVTFYLLQKLLPIITSQILFSIYWEHQGWQRCPRRRQSALTLFHRPDPEFEGPWGYHYKQKPNWHHMRVPPTVDDRLKNYNDRILGSCGG